MYKWLCVRPSSFIIGMRYVTKTNDRQNGKMNFTSSIHAAFSDDVMAAILVLQNNEMAAMFVYQTNPTGVETLLLRSHFLMFQ